MSKLPKANTYRSKELKHELTISLTELLPAQIDWDIAQFAEAQLANPESPAPRAPIAALEVLLEQGLDLEEYAHLLDQLEALPKHQKPQERVRLVKHLREYLVDGVFERHELDDLQEQLDFQSYHLIADLKTAFLHRFQLLCQKEQNYYDLMELVFGQRSPRYEGLLAQIVSGQFPFPALIERVDPDILPAQQATYNPSEGGILYLDDSLKFQPLLRSFSKKMAQHIAVLLELTPPQGCGSRLVEALVGQLIPPQEDLKRKPEPPSDRLRRFLEDVVKQPEHFIAELTDGKMWTGFVSQDVEDLLLYANVDKGRVNSYYGEKKKILDILIAHLPEVDDKYSMAQALVDALGANDISKTLRDYLQEALLKTLENPDSAEIAAYLTGRMREGLIQRLQKAQGSELKKTYQMLARYLQAPHLSDGDRLLFSKVWGDMFSLELSKVSSFPERDEVVHFLNFLNAMPPEALSPTWLGYRAERLRKHLKEVLHPLVKAGWKPAKQALHSLFK